MSAEDRVDPAAGARVSPAPVCARVLLLHTGGSLWVDAIGMQGSRVEPLLRWLPTSERADLGLVPTALSTLPCFQGPDAGRLSHLVAALSPGEVPAGESAQVAVALAALWYWRASRRGLACPRPRGPAVSPDRILAATGRVIAQACSEGLFRYVVGEVGDIDLKVAALAARRSEARHLDLIVPAAQSDEAAAAIARAFPDASPASAPRTWLVDDGRLRLHAVADLEDLEDVVEVVLSEIPTKDPAPVDLEPGALLEQRFVLKEPIGEGGAATVWRAVDRRDGSTVAVKVLHPHIARDAQRLAAFYRGARHMTRLDEGVARIVHSPGTDGPHRYFVLQYLPGGTLHDAVLGGRVRRDVAVVLGAAAALGVAHRRGLVHRDVKPTNVLLDGDGRLVLVDFDLARVLDATRSTTRSLGSLAFCAPEVLADGAGAATPASDVYSLAMTALFVLHGAEFPVEALRAPEDFLEAIDAPAATKWVLAGALSIDPGARPTDAGALYDALREAIAHPGARPYRGPSRRRVARLRQWTGRLAGMVAAVAVVAAVASVLGGLAYTDALEDVAAARARAVRAGLVERAWRDASRHPAEALALLLAAGDVDAATVGTLGSSGAASKVLRGPSKVLATDVSPDGKHVAAGFLDGHLVAWEVATGREVWRVQTGLERAKDVRFTPDGQALAAWAADATLQGERDARAVFYDPLTGVALDRLAVSGSPDVVTFGEQHALSREVDRVLFWDLHTALPLREEPGTGQISPDGLTAVMFGPTEMRLVRAEGTLRTAPWGPTIARRLHAWSGDGSRFAFGSTTELVVYGTEHLEAVGTVAVACHGRMWLDATGRRALCGGLGDEATLVRVDAGTVHPLRGHRGRLSVGAFVGGLVVTGSFDGSVQVWDGENGALVASLGGHDALVSAVAAGDHDTVITGSLDGTVRLWSLATVSGSHEVLARDVRGPVAIRGDHVASRDAAGALWIDGRQVGRLSFDDALRWSSDGRWLLATGLAGTTLWSADGMGGVVGAAGRLAAPSTSEPPRVALVGFDEDVFVGAPGEAFVRAPRRTSAIVQDLAWASDGARVVAFPYKDDAMVLDGIDARPVARLAGLGAGVTSHAFTADGGIVVGTWSVVAGRWDLATGEQRAAYVGHTEEVVAVDLSPDGARVATGSWDDTARVFDAATGAPLRVLEPGGGDVIDVAFAPDGGRLAVLTADRRTRIFDAADGALLAVQPGSRAKHIAWEAAGLLAVEEDGTVRRWQPAGRPAEGWTAWSGGATNLRTCAETGEVVAVTPWPDPSTTLAPASACTGVRDVAPEPPG